MGPARSGDCRHYSRLQWLEEVMQILLPARMMGYVTADVSTESTCQEALTRLNFIRVTAAANILGTNVDFLSLFLPQIPIAVGS